MLLLEPPARVINQLNVPVRLHIAQAGLNRRVAQFTNSARCD